MILMMPIIWEFSYRVFKDLYKSNKIIFCFFTLSFLYKRMVKGEQGKKKNTKYTLDIMKTLSLTLSLEQVLKSEISAVSVVVVLIKRSLREHAIVVEM